MKNIVFDEDSKGNLMRNSIDINSSNMEEEKLISEGNLRPTSNLTNNKMESES